MSVLCPQCGAPTQEGTTKCEYCGEKLEDGAVKVKLEVSREHTITCTDLADIFAADENIKSFRL